MNLLKYSIHLLFLCISIESNAQDLPLKIHDNDFPATDSIDHNKVKLTSDFIITTNGDTIKCIILKVPLFGAIYRLTNFSLIHKIRVSKVRGYYKARKEEMYTAFIHPEIYNGLFHTHSSEKSRFTYLKLLEQGRLKLYEFIKWSQADSHSMPAGPHNLEGVTASGTMFRQRVWYASEDGISLIEIKNNNVFVSDTPDREAFSEMIGNDDAASDLFNYQSSYSFRNIRYVIQRYNADYR